FELQFAVNHLAPFLLTNLLLQRLRASAPARIVNVASFAHAFGDIRFDDLHLERERGAMTAYRQSKLACVLFTHELARRLEGSGVTANCFHPGVCATQFGDREGVAWPIRVFWKAARPFLRTPERGAETAIYLACSERVAAMSGHYFESGRPRISRGRSNDRELAERLWSVSAQLTRLDLTSNPSGVHHGRNAPDQP
ncbi:MAG: SDR family NAD(P)-dependent oxidoreductase, partial [Deltaproteobacteria bacterium]|nr:SDR family NAD(P)-dependent oxidoreductase [Deltaproteobacteria bacterium]